MSQERKPLFLFLHPSRRTMAKAEVVNLEAEGYETGRIREPLKCETHERMLKTVFI